MGVSFELCIPSLLLLLTVSVATGQEQPVKYLDGTMKNETLGCSLEDEAVWYFNGTKLVDPVVANTGSLILIFTGERSKDKALTGKYECRANGNSSEQEATAVYYVYYPDQLLTINYSTICATPGEVNVTVGFRVDRATIGIEQRTCLLHSTSQSPEWPRLSSNGRTAVGAVNFTGQALTVRLICPISGHTLMSPEVIPFKATTLQSAPVDLHQPPQTLQVLWWLRPWLVLSLPLLPLLPLSLLVSQSTASGAVDNQLCTERMFCLSTPITLPFLMTMDWANVPSMEVPPPSPQQQEVTPLLPQKQEVTPPSP